MTLYHDRKRGVPFVRRGPGFKRRVKLAFVLQRPRQLVAIRREQPATTQDPPRLGRPMDE